MPGYCTGCRRIKQVRVTRMSAGPTQMGTCSTCEDKQAERARRPRPVRREGAPVQGENRP